MLFNNPLETIGNTPIVKLRKYRNAQLWLKLEGSNPTGSLKDRTAKKMILSKLQSGKIGNRILLDATSGSFGCSATFVANALNLKIKIVANKKLTANNELFLKYFGATIEHFGEITKDSYEHCLNLINQNPEMYCFLDQLNNWDSPLAHLETTAPEINNDLPQVKAIAASMGSGSTLWGMAKYFKKKNPDIKIIASNAKPGKKIAGTYLKGEDYVSPFMKDLWDQKWIDFTEAVSYERAIKNIRFLSKEKNFFVGPQTGGVYEAAIEAIRELNISGDVVLISGDTGWKNINHILPLI